MGKFLRQVLIAVLLFTALVVGMCFLLQSQAKKSNRSTNYGENNTVFVWGDSQMYQGIDVSMLGNELQKQVLTSSCHGSGIYDFLVSEKNIPDNAVSIVSFSEAALLRRPMADYNRTGFEFECVYEMLLSGCPIEECVRIFNLNKHSFKYKAYSNSPHIMNSYSDSLVYPELLPSWHPLFEEKKNWFSWKAKSYEKGLQHLYDKNCQMILIQFPFDEQVESFASQSVNRHLSDSLKSVIVEKYAMRCDTIRLHSDSLLMHDLSHMNEVGARLLTTNLVGVLQNDTTNNYFFRVVIE